MAKMLVVRVGQLCGGINGAWNAHEWVPTIVQSGKFVGCLPDDSRVSPHTHGSRPKS
jgi:hypothetical protein